MKLEKAKELRKDFCNRKGWNFIEFETIQDAEEYIIFLESKAQQNTTLDSKVDDNLQSAYDSLSKKEQAQRETIKKLLDNEKRLREVLQEFAYAQEGRWSRVTTKPHERLEKANKLLNND